MVDEWAGGKEFPAVVEKLLEGNRRFVRETFARNREFFTELARRQRPAVLWIGCSDSRVPVNTITGARPGDIFVHRNVANIVAADDGNLAAVLEYAIRHLRVPHIVICGHYGCGGIRALEALGPEDRHLSVWLARASPARERVERRLDADWPANSPEEKLDRMVEENVHLQFENLQAHPLVEEARRREAVGLHGWVYDLAAGTIKVLRSHRPSDPKRPAARPPRS